MSATVVEAAKNRREATTMLMQYKTFSVPKAIVFGLLAFVRDARGDSSVPWMGVAFLDKGAAV